MPDNPALKQLIDRSDALKVVMDTKGFRIINAYLEEQKKNAYGAVISGLHAKPDAISRETLISVSARIQAFNDLTDFIASEIDRGERARG